MTRATRIIAVLAVLLLGNLYLEFRPGSLFSLVKAVAFDKAVTPVYLCVGMDNLIKSLPAEGNIWLEFRGFDANPVDGGGAEGEKGRGAFWMRIVANFEEQKQSDMADLAALIYFRANYASFPRRVYVADDETVITNGRHIVENVFSPDGEWLKAHEVRMRVVITRNSSGEIFNRVDKL